MNVATRLGLGLALGLLVAGTGDAKTATQVGASHWEIGPIIDGRNYSRGVFRPAPLGAGFSFPISATAEPHYVTFSHGSLRGKTQIRMRFRVEGPRGAVIHGAKCSTRSPSAVTLYFARGDDDWVSDGGRWWATFASVPLAGPKGETEIVAPLNAGWTSVLRMTAATNPREFATAKARTSRVGFTFANCEGFGHGARATAPVRFVVTSFKVL